jgi:hypothetical protein
MGRKTIGSHRDCRVAEISPDIRDPAFLFSQLSSCKTIDDNTKPFARMGRKAHGSHADSRVAEISPDIRDPAFFVSKT